MKPWKSWYDALVWCQNNAQDDLWLLVSDWYEQGEYGFGTVARLKYESNSRCFFYKGFHNKPTGAVA